MKHSDLIFRELSREERRVLHQEQMKRDFPPDELKPLDMLEDLIGRGINSVWGCFLNGAMIGYFVLAQESGSGMILLDYLAVLPEYRDSGLGSLILRKLRENLSERAYLLIESENPEMALDEEEEQLRRRRVSFYQRNGGTLSSLKIWLFGVDYSVLTVCKGEPPSATQQEQDYCALYRKMLSQERFEKKIRTSFRK